MMNRPDGQAPPVSRRTTAILTICTAIIFGIWAGLFIDHWSFVAIDGQRYFNLADDALISMRYAWNLSHQQGLVWNPGERVEGYTNLLMTLWMALVQGVLQDKRLSVLAIQVFGAAVVLANAFIISRITAITWPDSTGRFYARLRPFAFLAALSYYYLDYWALAGMETGLLALLNSTGILLAFLAVRDFRWKYLAGMAITLGLAYLARPDSLLVAALVMAYVAYRLIRQRGIRPGMKQLMGMAGIYAVLPVAQEVFRLAYYGQLAPNTYTLKVTGIPLMIRLEDGLHFVTPFLVTLAPLIILAAVALWIDFSLEKLLPAAILATLTAYEVYVGGDPWVEWRIMSPAMPLLLAFLCYQVWDLSTWGISRLRRRFERASSIRANLAASVLAGSLLLVALVAANFNAHKFILLRARPSQIGYARAGVNTSILLHTLADPGASVGVTHAGVVPYYSGLYAIDYLGKSDPVIANRPPDISGTVAREGMHTKPGHNKYDLSYSLVSKLPTFTEVVRWGHDDMRSWADQHYVSVTIHRQTMLLSIASDDVHWDKVFDGLAPAGAAPAPGPALPIVVDVSQTAQRLLLDRLLADYYPGARIIDVIRPDGSKPTAGSTGSTGGPLDDPALARAISGADRVLIISDSEDVPDGSAARALGIDGYLMKDQTALNLRVMDFRRPPDLGQTQARFGDAIRLQGFDVSDTRIATCAKLSVVTWWQTDAPVDFNYSLFVGLRKDGQVIAQKDGPPAGTLMLLWTPGTVYRDISTLEVPCDAQPGQYQVVAALYNYETLQQLPLTPGPGTVFPITAITVR